MLCNLINTVSGNIRDRNIQCRCRRDINIVYTDAVTPDDLKLISGVGPKIEGTLHELGIFTFAQVAGWRQAECDWVDGYLNFKGRIERDEWIKQAEALAKGGEAEYIRVFGKKPR